MVSNSLSMELQDLLDILVRLRQQFSGDPEYQELRSSLPGDWSL
jgi:hypothetical protein